MDPLTRCDNSPHRCCGSRKAFLVLPRTAKGAYCPSLQSLMPFRTKVGRHQCYSLGDLLQQVCVKSAPMRLTLTTERTAKPAAPSRTAAGMERSGNNEPTRANWRTTFCALYSSADIEVASGGLNQERSADASVTSWMAGCTALLTVPACAQLQVSSSTGMHRQ